MRTLALVLPDLACELAALGRESTLGVAGALSLTSPLAVVLAPSAADLKPTSPLYGVTVRARRFGVCQGQTVAAARALVPELDVRRVAQVDLEKALARVAEMGLAFGPFVGFSAPDTVWVDVTGAAHLVGGESALVAELCERVRALGHRVRGAIAENPAVAQAVARFASVPQVVVPEGNDARALAPLPVRALPVDDESVGWLVRLGVMTVADLAALPRPGLAERLGPQAARLIALVDGHDTTPFPTYTPPRSLVEEMSWDEPFEGIESLAFCAHGLLGRLAARMQGRGEATRALEMRLTLERSSEGNNEPVIVRVELPAPMASAPDLLRVLRVKLEALVLPARVSGACVTATRLTRANRTQLDFERGAKARPDALALVVAELVAELGDAHVGTLAPRNSHLPEECTKLVAFDLDLGAAGKASGAEQLLLWQGYEPPTRLLPKPAPVRGKLVEGGMVTVENVPFRVQNVEPMGRLGHVSWWSTKPTNRDYARVWLATERGGAEAWVMRDRRRGGLCVHGWFV